ncbi:QRFP-like peptide receptor [Tachypleus tridentatus]|uniref:QRFP-like peptide receptor n=1 Tax=Tachypleus tridentatus TaxID=6853 RepID=UPI003FD2BB31
MGNETEIPDCVPIDILDFNFSQFDYSGPIKAFPETLTWKENLKIAFYVIIISMSLMGNAGVILTVSCNRTMRNTINFYLVNLAAADMLISGFCMWVHLVNNLTQPIFVLGPLMCKLNGFSQMTCLTSSVLTLTAIACDRFIAILFPFRARITKQRTGVVITVIWSVSLIVAIPFIIYREYYQIQWKDFVEAHCWETWPPVIVYDERLQKCVTTHPSKQLYYTFVAVTLFFLPVVIMATAYFLIIWKLWVSEVPGERNQANISVQNRSKKKVIKMVCVVLIAFVVCWLPLQVIILYSQFIHSSAEIGELPEWFSDVSYFANFFAYFNSALNPIIYGGFNSNFRKSLYVVMKCGCTNSQVQRRRYLASGISKTSRPTSTSTFSCTLARRKWFTNRENTRENVGRLKTAVDNEQGDGENHNLSNFRSLSSRKRPSGEGNTFQDERLKSSANIKLEEQV